MTLSILRDWAIFTLIAPFLLILGACFWLANGAERLLKGSR